MMTMKYTLYVRGNNVLKRCGSCKHIDVSLASEPCRTCHSTGSTVRFEVQDKEKVVRIVYHG